ncbi:endonuclease 4-like [Senna tora]|uniref:Aspergillus nuclease S1 n=1 Tax=Senna tora TaxID=362788 RepID=A0A834SHB8_9FABA|nr:endonuclease 4-like [Senna tora]
MVYHCQDSDHLVVHLRDHHGSHHVLKFPFQHQNPRQQRGTGQVFGGCPEIKSSSTSKKLDSNFRGHGIAQPTHKQPILRKPRVISWISNFHPFRRKDPRWSRVGAVDVCLKLSGQGLEEGLVTDTAEDAEEDDEAEDAAIWISDTPDFKCDYEYCRDCHDLYGHKGRCVTAAIYNYTMQLKSAYAANHSYVKYNLTEALMFLSHFVGDVHQPLHMGFSGDLGGNNIKLRWYHLQTNLHHVWDTLIIESALETFYNSDLSVMIQSIQTNITDNWWNDVSLWEECPHNYTACPVGYASESVSLACKYAYPNATAGSTLGDEYFLSRLPIVEERLARGGVRLAATLNRIFLPQTTFAQA